MLGKLLKYEWKSMGRVLPLFYLAILVLSVCLGISLRNSMFLDVQWGNVLFLSIYVILIIAMIVVTIVIIIERFYRSMISREGYLMHTLPVKPWQHVISKLIMAVIWIVIAAAVLIVSLLLIVAVSGALAELRGDMEFMELLHDMMTVFNNRQIALMIICTAVQGVRIIFQLYLAMAIGGSSTKNKVVYSFLAFIILAVIVSVIGVIVSMGIAATGTNGILELAVRTASEETMDVGGIFGDAFLCQTILDAVLAAVFFVLTNYFLKNKLNLQ